MPHVIDRDFLRKLAEWSADGAPVGSLYLDIDGRRFPRKQDYLLRAEELCHQLKRDAQGLDRHARSSVAKDTEKFLVWLEGLDRGPSRGVALFSCASAGLWEEVLVSRPVSDRATLSDHPYVLPLEALVETCETFCTVLVDREKARILLARMGRIREETGILDDVPGRHDQGGWSQARYQRHIEDHVERHLRHVGEELFRYFKRQGGISTTT